MWIVQTKYNDAETMTFKEKAIRINELENIILNNRTWINLGTDIQTRIAYLKGIDKLEVRKYLNSVQREKTAKELIDLGNRILKEMEG